MKTIWGDDNGYLAPKGSNAPIQTSVITLHPLPKGQVFKATHDGDRDTDRLPFMYRSFISFTFGGKYILDFGIIRVTEGLRMQNNLYTEFLDLTLEYDVLNGQFYWGTHFKPLVFQYLLSTDGMTQNQLDEFKMWFAPTKTRLLIRALHPNRGILARVLSPPIMNMLAFLGRERKKINDSLYEIPTTIYKGDIKISFICDEPFWYAIKNLIGERYKVTLDGNGNISSQELSTGGFSDLTLATEFYQYKWVDETGNLVPVMNSGDALKIILLDNIPNPSMIKIYTRLFLGDNITIDDVLYQRAALDGTLLRKTMAALASPNEGQNPPYAETSYSRVGVTYAPIIATFDIENSNVILKNNDNNPAYLYYAGNAPSYTILYFTLTPQLCSQLQDSDPPYILYPLNKYVSESHDGKAYNSIILEAQERYEFRFTTPSAWNGYNQAIYWFDKLARETINKDEEGNSINGTAWTDVKIYITEYVKHKGARDYALSIVETHMNDNSNNNVLDTTNLGTIFTEMSSFISNKSSSFIINSKNGVCTGSMNYGTNSNSVLENVGDMVRSNYLFLLETNHPNEDGKIVPWEQAHQCVYKITTDFPDPGLDNFAIEYKNMYY